MLRLDHIAVAGETRQAATDLVQNFLIPRTHGLHVHIIVMLVDLHLENVSIFQDILKRRLLLVLQLSQLLLTSGELPLELFQLLLILFKLDVLLKIISFLIFCFF